MPDSPTAQELFDELAAEQLARPDISRGKMLQSDSLRLNGKSFAFVSKERLFLKVPAARVNELVGLGEGENCELGGRRMREWVVVPATGSPEDRTRWRALLAESAAFIATLTDPAHKPH
ncbi:hypothetical protein SMC26_24270 [Actinomadura fulvescens]|uniref:TfoX N-terminal domain-containing protein n=1 Tax=Actinomadura fulvescens TaxID=46160 RepID=A0ABP6CGA4_9ACTN